MTKVMSFSEKISHVQNELKEFLKKDNCLKIQSSIYKAD